MKRRRHTRVPLLHVKAANVHMLDDVVIDRWDGDEIFVTSLEPIAIGEIVTLEDRTGSVRLVARAVSSSPVLRDKAVVHRVKLVPVGEGGQEPASERASDEA